MELKRPVMRVRVDTATMVRRVVVQGMVKSTLKMKVVRAQPANKERRMPEMLARMPRVAYSAMRMIRICLAEQPRVLRRTLSLTRW